MSGEVATTGKGSSADDSAAPAGRMSRFDCADATGRRRAHEVRARFGTADPYRIAEAAGVRVVSDGWDGLDGVRLLGTYADGVITLYEAQIDRVAADADIDPPALRKAVCTHELAHYELETAPPSG